MSSKTHGNRSILKGDLVNITQKLHDTFACHSDRTAATDSTRSITFAQLERTSRRIAAILISHAGPDTKVVLATDRSVFALVGIVSSIRAGVCYIPHEWDGKDTSGFGRINDVGKHIFLARGKGAQVLSAAGYHVIPLDDETGSDEIDFVPNASGLDLIYTIYTSGSTGLAKGVDITRDNVWHYATSLVNLLEIEEQLNYAYVSSLSADLGNTSLFLALLTGGNLHIVDDETRRDAERFQQYMVRHRIDVLKITPSHFTSLTVHAHANFKLRWLIFGGEALQAELVHLAFKRNWAHAVANHYGPTETTIGVACYPMRSSNAVPIDGTVPVGFPIGKTRFELLGVDGAPLAGTGDVEGELFIGGPSVGAGYSSDPELSMRRFLPLTHDQSGGKFYASGDLFRRHADGSYMFIGRKDRQVKIRGYRVDPDAIEAELGRYLNTPVAVLAVKQGQNRVASLQLVAVIATDATIEGIDAIKLRYKETIARVLPAHMRPGRVEIAPGLPITGNGKVDYKTLAQNLAVPRSLAESVDLVSAGVDQGLIDLAAEAWTRTLGRAPLSLDENFYSEGGDSILAIQLLSFLQNEQIAIKASSFYEMPTFSGLLQAMNYLADGDIYVDTAEPTNRRILGPIQEWFFENYPHGEDHWCQSVVIESAAPVVEDGLKRAVAELIEAHPIIGTSFQQRNDKWIADDKKTNPDDVYSFINLLQGQDPSHFMAALNDEISLSDGELLRIRLVRQKGQRDRIAIVCHHMIVDGVSWRILLDDLTRLYAAAVDNTKRPVAFDPRMYWGWTEQLSTLADREASGGNTGLPSRAHPLKRDFNVGTNHERATGVYWIGYNEEQTRVLLRDVPKSVGIPIQDVLLAAFLRSVNEELGNDEHVTVDVESHGRQMFPDRLDLNRAMGWFTALFPITVEVRNGLSFVETAGAVHDMLASAEASGVMYGINRYFSPNAAGEIVQSELCFNYLGHFVVDANDAVGWEFSSVYPGIARNPDCDRIYALKMTGRIVENRLALDLSYCRNFYALSTIENIAATFTRYLSGLLNASGLGSGRTDPRTLITENGTSGLLTYVPAELKASVQAKDERVMESVLLTGATGFIGIFLLKELLVQTRARVHCVIRAESDQNAAQRFWKNFAWYFPEDDIEALERRVDVHAGDISAYRLGLSAEVHEGLAATVDSVIHCAADVRLLAPIQELRRTNVQGTQHMIDFCLTGRSKQLHFVSTLSVAGTVREHTVFSERDLHIGQDFMTPYEQSKFEAEILVREFMAAGGEAKVYRTGSVSADNRGLFQSNIGTNRITQSLRSYVLTGCVPDRDEDLLLCPVDRLAQVIVRIALDRSNPEKTFHLTSCAPFMHNDLVRVLKDKGFNVTLTSRTLYLGALDAISTKYPQDAALGRMWVSRPMRGVAIDAKRTENYLNSLDFPIPAIDARWFSAFLDGCVERGYLPRVEETYFDMLCGD